MGDYRDTDRRGVHLHRRFALLWCAEALTLRANDKLKPWLYGVVGLIGYGVWACS